MAHDVSAGLPAWTWAAPAAGAALAVLTLSHALSDTSLPVIAVAGALLIAAVFAAVHHAEMLALKLGEPLGSLVLAAAVTVIEVALIVSIMLSGAEGAEFTARDTVFAAVMIVFNGVIGLCLVLGGRRHGEQSFRLDAASAALAVLGVLATITLVLPNFVESGGLRQFSSPQLLVVGLVSLAVYGVFLFVQTVKHRDYFLDADAPHPAAPPRRIVGASAVLLPVSLLVVILLAKILSHPLDDAVAAAGLPQAVVGVVIAALVLLPEGIASVRAALANHLQNSVNLGLGSALASIGMTVPVVAVVAILSGQPLTLGLPPALTALLLLTLFVGTITLGTGRTTVLQGAVHLGIFAVFALLTVAP